MAAKDLLGGLVVIDGELRLEHGFEGMRQRGVSDIVQQGRDRDQAPLVRPELPDVRIEQRQPGDAEAMLVARVAAATGLAVRRRDAGVVDAAEEADVAQPLEGRGRDQAGQQRVDVGRPPPGRAAP